MWTVQAPHRPAPQPYLVPVRFAASRSAHSSGVSGGRSKATGLPLMVKRVMTDTASRWRYLKVYEEYTSYYSVCFLKEVIEKFKYKIQAIKTDNGSVFTNYYLGTNKRSDVLVKTLHGLDTFCTEHNIIHYLIDPGKPAQNGTVERSHREDQEKFYEKHKFKSMIDLQNKLKIWNEYYNNLEHCGLHGKTPNEMLGLQVTNVCT